MVLTTSWGQWLISKEGGTCVVLAEIRLIFRKKKFSLLFYFFVRYKKESCNMSG